MKFLLLAAAAAIAVPAVAQETPDTATSQTMPGGDPSQAGSPDSSTSMPQSDPSMQQSSTQSTGDSSMGGGAMSAQTDPNAADPAGGYAPMTSGSGPAQPGATVVFQQAPSPSQAFPPPPPMKSYPICKKGQYDNCMQRGGR